MNPSPRSDNLASSLGTLYIVATPIGHLADISERALQTLRQVTVIAAEDTRHSQRLLSHYGISQRLWSLHDHNESERLQQVLALLSQGSDVALISDAGTPLISDPGYRLVRATLEAGYRVSPIPGAAAVTAALSVAGQPTDRFLFEGFLPAKREARRKRLAAVVEESATLVFYESPHRILESLQDMAELLGGARSITLCRELTKQYETILLSTLAELPLILHNDANQCRGEFVLLVHGALPVAAGATVSDEALRIAKILATELAPRQAAGLTAQITGEKRNAIYAALLEREDVPITAS
ncbi:MAG: 16S rRNA (cytidine(1402)-2'-O)-methyltransferase [Gammaproteobacteria bacterium]|nr:16S rRNA (cytidine(1402)-2'-O)-methyltransferase [Gammaproteobacteria bacterium]